MKLTALALLLIALALGIGSWRNPDFWRTADQRGEALFEAGEYEKAAQAFRDPARAGAAQYRNGDFEAAAKTFARVPGETGVFNQGNAHLMHGNYDGAIASYDRALKLRPGWPEAVENRDLALARQKLIQTKGGDMGADLGADKVVFDLNAKRGGKETQTPDGGPPSDAELQASWLRRVQTTPGDFLQAKFSYQAQMAAQNPPPPK